MEKFYVVTGCEYETGIREPLTGPISRARAEHILASHTFMVVDGASYIYLRIESV